MTCRLPTSPSRSWRITSIVVIANSEVEKRLSIIDYVCNSIVKIFFYPYMYFKWMPSSSTSSWLVVGAYSGSKTSHTIARLLVANWWWLQLCCPDISCNLYMCEWLCVYLSRSKLGKVIRFPLFLVHLGCTRFTFTYWWSFRQSGRH